ncbi:MAG TPA: hypothetical protein VGF48_26150 [Thermoanaerobaculia bacterium]|jgi:hypothetical protein
MATYYTQDAKVGNDTNRFYGDQAAHAHETGVDFSKAIKEIMKVTYGKDAKIALGKFFSNQSKIPTGGTRVVQLKWKNNGWTNA